MRRIFAVSALAIVNQLKEWGEPSQVRKLIEANEVRVVSGPSHRIVVLDKLWKRIMKLSHAIILGCNYIWREAKREQVSNRLKFPVRSVHMIKMIGVFFL